MTSPTPPAPSSVARPPAYLAYGRLLRLSLMPSALADVAAGVLLGSGRWSGEPRVALAFGATLGVYHGAMALNDWADREQDARTRPERPIPSGAVAPGTALGLGLLLVGAGVLCAALLEATLAVWMGAVAACAVFYDVAGRGPWRGPLLLAACRFGNLGFGALVGLSLTAQPGSPFDQLVSRPLLLLPALLYGLYVFAVSRLGRLEDGEGGAELGSRPRRHLLTAALALAAVGVLPWITPGPLAGRLACAALALAGASGLVRAARRAEWEPRHVGQAMGLALRRLLIFTAASALLVNDASAWPVAALILAGYPLSYGLRRVFPPS